MRQSHLGLRVFEREKDGSPEETDNVWRRISERLISRIECSRSWVRASGFASLSAVPLCRYSKALLPLDAQVLFAF